jgi:hypothetical protein
MRATSNLDHLAHALLRLTCTAILLILFVSWVRPTVAAPKRPAAKQLPRKLTMTFSNPLHSMLLPGLPVVTCAPSGSTTNQQTLTWVSPWSQPTALVSGIIWLGVDANALEDVNVTFLNLTSGDVYRATNDDHYANRTGADASDIHFGSPPYYWIVNPGDTLQLRLGCVGQAGMHAGATVGLDYLTTLSGQ